ncbi:MAG: 16S rRNA (uracil(1498)-N(3))-methyltransferase [Deltaproteobacteria bacterium]|nr:16S rRNA (uracil(1498)-N(3))-methyltransferase [Deltaproteobacteria bacterium]
MNIILLEEADFVTPRRVAIGGRRASHIKNVLKSQLKDSLRVGLLNGDLGSGMIVELAKDRVGLEVDFDRAPPEPLPLRLLLALPRPKVLRRVLAAAVTMGVKEIFIFNSWRVEKSYWQSPWLEARSLREVALLALEQAGDTVMPEIFLRPRFRPFVEDEVPQMALQGRAWLLHPAAETPLREVRGPEVSGPQSCSQRPVLVAVGPEGGFIPFEVEIFLAAGLKPVSLGPRILRVEQALPAIIGNFLR